MPARRISASRRFAALAYVVLLATDLLAATSSVIRLLAGISWICCPAGVLLMVFAWAYYLRDQLVLRLRGVRVPGTLVRYVESSPRSDLRHPVYRFRTADGVEHEHRSSIAVVLPRRSGRMVDVLYDPRDPSLVAGTWWPFGRTVVGLLLGLLGACLTASLVIVTAHVFAARF